MVLGHKIDVLGNVKVKCQIYVVIVIKSKSMNILYCRRKCGSQNGLRACSH